MFDRRYCKHVFLSYSCLPWRSVVHSPENQNLKINILIFYRLWKIRLTNECAKCSMKCALPFMETQWPILWYWMNLICKVKNTESRTNSPFKCWLWPVHFWLVLCVTYIRSFLWYWKLFSQVGLNMFQINWLFIEAFLTEFTHKPVFSSVSW